MSVGLADLTSIDEASVRVGGQPTAVLRRLSDRVRLEYLASADADVAITLPRRSTPYDTHSAGAVHPFFAGLLPEGRRLTALRGRMKASADDDFTMLLAVGGDVVGNVSVTPLDDVLDRTVVPALSIARGKLGEVDFGALFEQSVGADPDPYGVPGVQDKVSARMITFAVRGADALGATHILKLNPPEFPHLVENEFFFLAAARTSGITVNDAELVHDAQGRVGLLVKRFDRVVTRSGHLSVAQEDGCQVLGRYPADKYRPDLDQLATALMSVCAAALVAGRTLIEQFAFAYLTANGDAHAKNFSVLRHEHEWRISPAYDLPSSRPYGDTTLALALQDKRDERIGRKDFVALGERVGVRERAVVSVLDRLIDASEEWIDRLETLPFDERRIRDLRRSVEYRRRRLQGK